MLKELTINETNNQIIDKKTTKIESTMLQDQIREARNARKFPPCKMLKRQRKVPSLTSTNISFIIGGFHCGQSLKFHGDNTCSYSWPPTLMLVFDCILKVGASFPNQTHQKKTLSCFFTNKIIYRWYVWVQQSFPL